ncbi:uncharacterized protein UV8b_07708 [Ustilaginoidea virens]|uniref:Metal homeostatis protein bsd2 n=1 Tax=Ustilaginoidea virens TaxID=1159556 RepID=A0A8E5ML93_USTVR|nr:uncharacterized protein UV8b_07708 [Ustilaginoidea virens]QUC23467.1 hypothetical protein UV8b_07708 [Ustilaginoidea virens]
MPAPGRYERVHDRDDDDDSHLSIEPKSMQPIPNSPPPSFRSRASSPTRRDAVDPDLADAFDDDASDEEADDRQRLVRRNAPPSDSSSISLRVDDGTSLAQSAPTTQSNVASSAIRGRVVGGGGGSDGVFANLSAKPERTDSEKDEMPPSYEQAAADAAPPYWETTILAPGMGGLDEVYIEGMPVGSVFSFVWNGMISTSFQLVGFLLTYLLHSTHAAKNGSRAGLGITLIQYGFYMKDSGSSSPPVMNGPDGYAAPPDPNSHDFNSGEVTDGGPVTITGSEWMAYVLMVVGWFILIKSVAEFLKARRHEQLVLQSPDRGLGVPVVADGERPEHVV